MFSINSILFHSELSQNRKCSINKIANYDEVKSIDQINKWIADKKENKITNIINNIDNSDLVVLNAVYILSDWKVPFQDLGLLRYYNLYNKLTFPNSEGKEFEWKFMKGQESNYNYYEDSACQAVQLDYKDDLIKAIIILPKEPLDDYLKGFSSFELHHIVSSMKSQMIALVLPEFEMQFNTDLQGVLTSMGIVKAFSTK